MDSLVGSGRLLQAAPTPTPVLRHAAHFGALIALTLVADVLAADRLGPETSLSARLLYGAIVGANVLVMATWSWSTVLGAIAILAARCGVAVGGPVLMPPTGGARTALLMPIFEEDAARVLAAARAMSDAAAAHGIGAIDCFVLSDSRSPEAIAAERRMMALAARPDDGGPRIFYRRRADNAGRKAGNIAAFVRSWGALYDFAVVLDADSLMSGTAIARLVGAMEANPRAGLIQAMCYPVGRSSIFARWQQFNARLHGPLFQRGVALWQGPRGNFWGHNAIVRLTAFASSCGLPRLPGSPPLGGDILSHDTVEAALMLRGGWDVWMLPDGPDGTHEGSWEETPTNLVDHLDRDRRWCLGNLQHVRVLGAQGFKLASLYHLSRGLLHYFYAPLVLAWLALYALLDRRIRPDALLCLLVAIIVGPRLLCLTAALLDRAQARGFGGRLSLVASFLVDQLLVTLVYPVTAVFHLRVLASALGGGEVKWQTQSRGDRGLAWAATVRQLAGPVACGAVSLVLLAFVAPLPVALLMPGLVLAIPVAVLGSRRLTIERLLKTPEEASPDVIWCERLRIEDMLRRDMRLDSDGEARALPADAGLPMPSQALTSKKVL